MRPFVIVNPRSGAGPHGRGGDFLRDVLGVLERRIGPTDVALTARPGHAIDLARDAVSEGRTRLIAIGGDGTLHEVANGILDSGGAAALGYIGLGTGGDFRRTLGIEHRLDAYVSAISAGRDRAIDVGKVRYHDADGALRERWFLNVVSVGMGGLVDRYIPEMSKAFGGRVAYFCASARALVESQRARLSCASELGGVRRELAIDTFVLAVCNGRYFGGGMHVAPMAEPDDGRFEVVSIDAESKWAFLAASPKIYRGTHISTPGAHFACDALSVKLVSERAKGVFLLDVDGEALGGLPVEVTLVPKALVVRAPLGGGLGRAKDAL